MFQDSLRLETVWPIKYYMYYITKITLSVERAPLVSLLLFR